MLAAIRRQVPNWACQRSQGSAVPRSRQLPGPGSAPAFVKCHDGGNPEAGRAQGWILSGVHGYHRPR